jgi:hypothetical protein
LGTSVSNVHVKVNDQTHPENAAVVALRHWLYQMGFVETDDLGNAEIELLLLPPNPEPWLSVYVRRDWQKWGLDHVIMGQLSGNQIAPMLSHATKSIVVDSGLMDSDVAHMCLFHNGTLVDRFCNWDNYGDMTGWIEDERGVPTPPKDFDFTQIAVGSADRWISVLPAGTTADALEQAWKPDEADYPFEAEGILIRTLNLLQIGVKRGWGDDELFNGINLPNHIHLGFRRG